jgi:predicted Zn-dependent protease with MMP-like domain
MIVGQLLSPEQKPILWLGLLAILVVFYLWISFDLKRSQQEIDDPQPGEEPPIAPKELDWEKLAAVARSVIDRTISQFPEELRTEADKLGWSWYKWSLDVGAPGVLGHFWGPARQAETDFSGEERQPALSAAITLYLGNLSEYCEEQGLDFEDEVRRTYLHELGHYLGLDEADLEERGLQ